MYECNFWPWIYLSGCPRYLRQDKVVSDPLLLVEIEEMRSMSKENMTATLVEDFTMTDDEEEDWWEHLLLERSRIPIRILN